MVSGTSSRSSSTSRRTPCTCARGCECRASQPDVQTVQREQIRRAGPTDLAPSERDGLTAVMQRCTRD